MEVQQVPASYLCHNLVHLEWLPCLPVLGANQQVNHTASSWHHIGVLLANVPGLSHICMQAALCPAWETVHYCMQKMPVFVTAVKHCI